MNLPLNFRGLRADGKGWVYGLPVKQREKDSSGAYTGNFVYSIFSYADPVGLWLVDEKTINQSLGVLDCNANEIFAGDYVKTVQPSGGVLAPAPPSVGIAMLHANYGVCIEFYKESWGCNSHINLVGKINEVVGNIYESEVTNV